MSRVRSSSSSPTHRSARTRTRRPRRRGARSARRCRVAAGARARPGRSPASSAGRRPGRRPTARRSRRVGAASRAWRRTRATARRTPTGSDARAVAADLGVAAALPGGVVEQLAREVGHLRQPELLALIEVRGPGQREHEQRQRASPPAAELQIGERLAALAQLPGVEIHVVGERQPGDMARRVVAREHPGAGRPPGVGLERARQDGPAPRLRIPPEREEIEGERLAELVGPRVEVAARALDRLGHGRPRRVVLVRHAPPGAEDLVHLVAVVNGMGAVGELVPAVRVRAAVVAQRVEILRQAVRDVDAEAVDAAVDQKRSVARSPL